MILEKIQVGAGRHDPAHRAIRRNNCETFLDTSEIAGISEFESQLVDIAAGVPLSDLLSLHKRLRIVPAGLSFADPSGSPAIGLHRVAAVRGGR